MPIIPTIKKIAFVTVALGLSTALLNASAIAAETTLDVLYAWPEIKSFQVPLADKFMKENPDIKIKFRLPAKNYAEANLAVARSAITGDLPDVYFSGYSVLKPMVDLLSERKQAISLAPYLKAEGADWVNNNYGEALLGLGQVAGIQYAIPFNASTPIVYFNADLVKLAGHDAAAFPTDWDGIIKLTKDINALSDDIGGLDYSVGSGSSDWLWQAIIQSLGGKIVNDEGTGVGFDNETGLKAMRLLQRIAKETGMNVANNSDLFRQQFFAGKLGMFITSPSSVANFTEAVGDRFTMLTAPYPMSVADGGLPTGGNAIAITAQDQTHQEAAWKYVKFLTNAESQAFVAKATGYMPTNKQAGKALSSFYAANPNYATAFKQVGYASPWFSYPSGNSKEIWHSQREIIDQLQRGNITPEEGLKQIVKATNTLVQ